VQPDLVTLDFETHYAKDYSLSKMTTESYIRDPRFETIMCGFKINDERAYWVPGPEVGKHIKSLQLEKRKVLCHHTAFDAAIMAWHYDTHPAMLLDTMSMARPVTGQTVGVSLAALAKKFMLGEKGTEVIKALGMRYADFTPSQLQEYGGYCVNDVELTYILFQVLQQFSTPQELYLIDMLIRMFTDPVVEFDRTTLREHLNEVQAKKERLLARVEQVCGKDGLMSNDQLAQILEKLGVEPPTKISVAKTANAKTNPGGEPVYTYAFSKTDEGFKALLEHEDPRVQAVVAARLGVKSTLEETRTQSFIGISDRGALPIYYNYYGAHTGRGSGGDKVNLQNLPRGGNLRKAMKAPPGHVVAACDSAAIEARVVAWWAGQQDLVDDFAAGVDIYSKFASDIYGRPINRKFKEIVDGKEVFPMFKEGFVGKTAVLGLGFGMGADNFERQLRKEKIPGGLTFAQQVVDLYRGKYHMIPKLWKQCDDAMRNVVRGFTSYIGVGIPLKWDQDGIHLPNGMLIRYPELKRGKDGYEYKSRSGWTKLYGGKIVENVVQALARIVVFNQMGMIDQQLRKLDDRVSRKRHKVVGTTHDEVIAVCPVEFREQLVDMMLQCMRKVPKWAAGLPINCEAESGNNYGDCK